MSESTVDNKRIAKNTLLLYMRMLFMMGLSLFTSRVLLNALGIEDYGVYNVVGGVLGMFGFISGSMSAASQRYITFALGQNDMKRLKTVLSTSLQIHVFIALVVALLGEVIGLWFLYHKLQIPEGRMDAAFWVLQASVISSLIGIIGVPYNAAIVAHEKMSAFAYISIFDVVMKLLFVYAIVVINTDKLILYAFLLMLMQNVTTFCYMYYCHKHFEESRYTKTWEPQLFREMMGFAGWNVFGQFSAVCFGQGLNILLNMFFGPVVNAARGVSYQVQGAIQGFVNNFQMALNPQITKTYARGEMTEMHKLMFRSSRFSFFLLFFLSLPVLFETNFILTLWLKIVPDNTIVFLRLIICISLIYCLSNPLIVASQATGDVKNYQIVCGSILIAILPISYVCLKLGMPAYSVFIVHFCMESICMLARMIMLRSKIGLRIRDYIKYIHRPVITVVVLSTILPWLVYTHLADGVLRFLAVGVTCVISVGGTIFMVGLTKGERQFFKSKISGYLMSGDKSVTRVRDKENY